MSSHPATASLYLLGQLLISISDNWIPNSNRDKIRCLTMASHIVGYPRMGPKRELKFALESFWDGRSSADDLQKVASDFRSSIWKQMIKDAGIKYIPSNTFSFYDQVHDTTCHGNDQMVRHKLLGVDTVPVLVGPVSYLLLSKPAKGVDKTFNLLSLLDKILPVYKVLLECIKVQVSSTLMLQRLKKDVLTELLSNEGNRCKRFRF
ncbi:hypothetical protein LXL04_013272 [Taraxacum kok-saghyz]